MTGILAPTSGSIDLHDQRITVNSNKYHQKIGVVFGQRSNLWTDIPLIESYKMVKSIYKVETLRFKKNFDMIVELLNLEDILYLPPRKMSLGQRMKADIGMSILHEPDIVFLDEPTIGLDINMKYTIRSFIKTINQKKGVTVFLTSHDLDDLDEICKNILVLSKGKIFYEGRIDELKQKYADERKVIINGIYKSDLSKKFPNLKVETEGLRTQLTYKKGEYSSQEILNIISSAFDIEDISIQEPGIEHVVSNIYSKMSG